MSAWTSTPADARAASHSRCSTRTRRSDRSSMAGVTGRAIGRMAVHARRLMPVLTARAAKVARHAGRLEVHASDIDARMAAARRIFEDVDLFVAPSPSLAREFQRFGLSADRLRVSDYGMSDWPARPERAPVPAASHRPGRDARLAQGRARARRRVTLTAAGRISRDDFRIDRYLSRLCLGASRCGRRDCRLNSAAPFHPIAPQAFTPASTCSSFHRSGRRIRPS